MSNSYAAAIETLTNENVDFRRIAIELAKIQPALFLRLHRNEKPVKIVQSILTPAQTVEIISCIRTGNRVGSIKALRMARGLGLKEAKDIIDIIDTVNLEANEYTRVDEINLPLVNEIREAFRASLKG